jgi:hypothetical protein
MLTRFPSVLVCPTLPANEVLVGFASHLYSQLYGLLPARDPHRCSLARVVADKGQTVFTVLTLKHGT